jgi:hypothetical protein
MKRTLRLCELCGKPEKVQVLADGHAWSDMGTFLQAHMKCITKEMDKIHKREARERHAKGGTA